MHSIHPLRESGRPQRVRRATCTVTELEETFMETYIRLTACAIAIIAILVFVTASYTSFERQIVL
ncbi:hypothetical protein SERLA73DRAFT_188353, partial [Serpula lacrymans var. lacrymans S7.3]